MQSEAERAFLRPAVLDHNDPYWDVIYKRNLGKGLIVEAAIQIGPCPLLRSLRGCELVVLPCVPDNINQRRAV